jgi:POLQ-like helicase
MKPETESKKVLKYTQSIAKMIEFNVPKEERNIMLPKKPEELFSLVIGMMGDLAVAYMSESPDFDQIRIQEEELRFCAVFFDNYENTKRSGFLDPYLLLVGAVAYYMCNLPGSAHVLVNKIKSETLHLDSERLETVLYWLLKGDFSRNLSLLDSAYSNYIISITSSICDFFSNGIEETIIDNCKKLRSHVYRQGSARELFFCDLLCAIIIKKINNSCWQNLPFFSDLEKSMWSSTIKKYNFIKELWPAQILLGKEGVFKGQSAVIQMPTSAGKTKSTEIIIRSAFLSNRTDISVVVAPFRALCHEIQNDFYKSFARESNISIDEINDAFDDSGLSVFDTEEKKHIIILTPEKLYYLLSQRQDFASRIGLIIFDEGHQFDARERGVTYELLLTELKRLLSESSQKILISAVIHNAAQIADWLSADDKVVSGVKSLPTQRSIGFVNFDYGQGQIQFVEYNNPDEDTGYVPKVIPIVELPKKGKESKKRYFPDKDDSKSIALYLGIKMSQNDSVAIFCGKKNTANSILEQAVKELYSRQSDYLKPANNCNKEELKKLIHLIKDNLGSESFIYKASLLGMFPHHADVPHGIRMAIEYALHESLINFIVCTSTLAQGVNLPIKYLFIPTTQQGRDSISVRDFHNLIGRVGRAGKLTEGCIIFTNPEINKKNSYLWNKTKGLLNPELAENCTSSLLSIFEPFNDVDGRPVKLYENLSLLASLYFSSTAQEIARSFVEKYSAVQIDGIEKFIEMKFRLIEKIENFLMMLGESLQPIVVENIAKSTLAYKLASDEQKNEIINLFTTISNNILKKIPDAAELSVYAKTLHGLNKSLQLKEYVKTENEEISSCNSYEDFLNVLWDSLSKENIHACFDNYPNKEKLREAVLAWVAGKSYPEIFKILSKEKIGRFFIKQEQCISMFENGLGYNGAVFINALTELFASLEIDDSEKTIQRLQLFQKQLKYGLPTIESIFIYEFGFCDRVIAQNIANCVPSSNDKDILNMNLLRYKNSVSTVLKAYPSYYETVYERIQDSSI